MIVILSDAMTEGEIDSTNEIYSKLNKKMHSISRHILGDKFKAEEAVEKAFFEIIDNIEKISILPYPRREIECLMILNNAIISIQEEGKKSTYVEKTNYFNHKDATYNRKYE